MTTIALEEHELALVRSILKAHLPADVSVGVFGSRAGGRVKPFSDLDLVLEGRSLCCGPSCPRSPKLSTKACCPSRSIWSTG